MRTKFDDSGIQVKEELIEEDDCEQQTTSKRPRNDHFDNEDDDNIARGSLPPARKRIKRELNNELNDDEPKNNERDRKSRKASLINEKLIKRIRKTRIDCGLKVIYDRRHITVGWHQCGRVQEAIESIFTKSIGQYRKQINAVPLCIKKIKIDENPRIIADQRCMHMDVSVKMIVFHPTVGHPYRCTVASIGKYLITAKIFDAITFVAPIDGTVHSIPNVGDVVSIEFREVDFKKSLCQMKGVLVARRKEKTNKVTFVDDDDDDDDGKG